jgi:hypothetical protein
MVQKGLIGYEGPSLLTYLDERIRRRSKVGYGEAVYISKCCEYEDLQAIERYLPLASDDATRDARVCSTASCWAAPACRRTGRATP